MPVIPAFERLRQETVSSRPAWAISEDSEDREGGGKGGRKEKGMEEKKVGRERLERVKNRAEEIAQSVKALLGKHEVQV